MLANGALITADLPTALFFLASLPAMWWVLHEITPGSLLVGGLVLGGLFLCKYSAAIIVPVAGLLVLLRLADGRELPVRWWSVRRTVTGWRNLLKVFAGAAVVQAVIIWALIWASFGCRYVVFNEPVAGPGQLRPGWSAVYEQGPTVLDFQESTTARLIKETNDWCLLPEGYLYWFAYTLRVSMRREAFLNGEWSNRGFPSFFPYCFLVKTQLGIFAVLLLAVLAMRVLWQPRAWRESWRGFYATAPLWTFLIVYWVFAVTSHINIGHRHILPTYPVMYVLAGAAAAFWSRLLVNGKEASERKVTDEWRAEKDVAAQATPASQVASSQPSTLNPQPSSLNPHPSTLNPQPSSLNPHPSSFIPHPSSFIPHPSAVFCGLLLLTAVGWAAVDSLRIWPNYLAYFNQIAGGPRQAYKHLVDSSLDWGRDLPGLKKWLDEKDRNRDQPVYLAYFGMGEPKHYRIVHPLPPPSGFKGPRSLICFGKIGLLGSPLGQGPLLAAATYIPGEYPELPDRIPETLEPGIYASAPTYLQGVDEKVPFGRGRWTDEYERLYQENRAFCWHYNHRDSIPESRMALSYYERYGNRTREMFVKSYHELRFARLLKYLREKRRAERPCQLFDLDLSGDSRGSGGGLAAVGDRRIAVI